MNSIPQVFKNILSKLPEEIASHASDRLESLCEKEHLQQSLAGFSPVRASELVKTLVASDFFYSQLPRLGTDFFATLDEGINGELAPGEYQQTLGQLVQACEDEKQLEKCVRNFRNLHMMRITWRDANGIGFLETSMAELSALADACVQQVYTRLYRWETAARGIPRNSEGEQQHLVVLGMGKLGARELNFSSDIDLIFCFPESGQTDGESTIANQDFFNRLGKQLINTLSRRTAEGFAYRVDMRLRPMGNAGALTLSFNAMETYYEEQGREWERYAMIKARPVAGDLEKGLELLCRIKPFVYRRYIDFGVLESLRDMKELINQEVRRKGNEGNIKLGAGGIREVEFIVQALQLISGGRHLDLQDPGLLPVMALLGEYALLDEKTVAGLRESYCFLRTLEHRLQAINDEQTQLLPASEAIRNRIAWVGGFDSWQDYLDELEKHRCRIRDFFGGFISGEEAAGGDEEPVEKKDWLLCLQEQGVDALSGLGIAGNDEVCNYIAGFSKMSAVKRLAGVPRDRLNQLMPQVFHSIEQAPEPMQTTRKVLGLVEKVLRRSVYLSLLLENPEAYEKMVDLMQLSNLATKWLTDHPALLEEFTVDRELRFDKPYLADQLQQQLLRIPEDDVEQQMECLRYFQKGHQLRCASEELHKLLKVEWASQYLSNLAEVLLQQAYTMAFYHVARSHGMDASQVMDANFAIIGYGKMGGSELSYGSDLDLVFLHHSGLGVDDSASMEAGKFYARLGQRLIHILSTRTMSGQMYEVDARLRPSGASGMLVSSMDSFEEYQMQKAWTWEHQALVRARWVAGDSAGRERFGEIRTRVLCQPREEAVLRDEVLKMRAKMVEHLGSGGNAGLFDLKHDHGGIVDIEFMVQYAVLRWASEYPALTRETSTLQLLDRLAEFVPGFKQISGPLKDAYRDFREAVHLLALNEEKPLVPADRFVTRREAVMDARLKILGA